MTPVKNRNPLSGITSILFIVMTFILFALTVCSSKERGMNMTVQNKLDALRIAKEIPGANLTVVYENGRTQSWSTGVADTETGAALNTEDRMPAGSVGKTFFMAVIMKAVDAGELNLDDPMSRYLGDEPWFSRLRGADKVTLRMLMSHTSGFNDHIMADDFRLHLMDHPDKVYEPAEMVGFVLDQDPLFEAGKGWAYTDTNFILAAMMYEAATGRRCYDDIKKQVLEPLNLTATYPQVGRHLPGVVQGLTGPEPFRFPDKVMQDGLYVRDPQFEWAGGGMVSNTVDLARWAMALYTGKVFSLDGVSAITAAYDTETGEAAEYGYGLGTQIYDTKAGKAIGHGGIFPGYQTIIKYFPEYRLAVSMQVNQDRCSNEALHEVYDFVDDFIKDLKR